MITLIINKERNKMPESNKELTQEILKSDYRKAANEFMQEYKEAPLGKAYGSDPLTGEWNKSRKQVLDAFKDMNKMYKSMAKAMGCKLTIVDVSDLNPPDDDDHDLG